MRTILLVSHNESLLGHDLKLPKVCSVMDLFGLSQVLVNLPHGSGFKLPENMKDFDFGVRWFGQMGKWYFQLRRPYYDESRMLTDS